MPSTGIRPKHQPYCTRSTQQAGTTATVAQTERCVCHSPAHPVAVENPPQPSSTAVMPTPCRHARATTGRRRATNPRGLHTASTKAVAAAPPAVRRRREDARRTAHSPPLTLRAHTSTVPRHTRRDWPPPRHYGAAPGQCRTSTAPHQPPGSRMAPAPRTSAERHRDRAGHKPALRTHATERQSPQPHLSRHRYSMAVRPPLTSAAAAPRQLAVDPSRGQPDPIVGRPDPWPRAAAAANAGGPQRVEPPPRRRRRRPGDPHAHPAGLSGGGRGGEWRGGGRRRCSVTARVAPSGGDRAGESNFT
jgi:hypothetical protein